ncbi:uncharacterized protein LOC111521515 [Piliocolobus tephrosceles]|uniref:uncharacterized protein LOC111521515 n=1 Tax=Piliocolobus tephrosceles TaxID=591936 RepID=UPI001301521A|nr:uncharacterized protein LOC111521515 [Piliocolobus tephrosceles]
MSLNKSKKLESKMGQGDTGRKGGKGNCTGCLCSLEKPAGGSNTSWESPSPALQPLPFPLPAGAPRVRSSWPRPAGGGRPLPGAQAGPRARPASPPRAWAEERAPRTRRLGREGGIGSPEEGSGKAAKGAEGAGRAGLGGDEEGAGRAALAPAAALEQRAAGPGTQLGDGDRDAGPQGLPVPHLWSSPCRRPQVHPGIPGTRGAEQTWAGCNGVPGLEKTRVAPCELEEPRCPARPRGVQTCRDCGQREGWLLEEGRRINEEKELE